MRDQVDIALFGDFGRTGGIERSLAEQVAVWVEAGHRVELVIFRNGERLYPDMLPSAVSEVHLNTSGKWATLFRLMRYLRKQRPKVMLSSAHIPNTIVGRCAALSRLHETRLFVSVHSNYVHSPKRGRGKAYRKKLDQVKRIYPRTHGIITVSDGLASALREHAGLSEVPIYTVYNGCIPKRLRALAAEPPEHQWYRDRKIPVLVAVGRLAASKDYPTMLKAVAKIRQKRPVRLVILGEGPEQTPLEIQCKDLGIADAVDFAGFNDNPFTFMAHANAFLFTSVSEGFGNVVAEALATGVPVISTDCPSGPAEILAHGRYGKLVPMGAPNAFAEAVLETLDGHHPKYDPVLAVEQFTGRYAAARTLEIFGLGQA